MQNIGVIIGRFNPIHLGHISLINESLKNCEKNLVILGSANIINDNNPFSLQERIYLLKKEFGNKILIDYLNDTENNEEWINNLIGIITKYINSDYSITFYGGDLKNDYAIKVIGEYIDNFGVNKINFVEVNRNIIPISATQIRDYLNTNSIDEAGMWLSEKTKKDIIKKY